MKYIAILLFSVLILSTMGCGSETCYEEKGLMTLEEFFALPENANINPIVDDSGLQYVINNPGGELKPVATADIVVGYSGMLINEGMDVFDSRSTDNPLRFNLSRLIRGWQIGIRKIGAGGSITLYVPAELAYGSRGQGADICPNADLIFDIDLVSFTQ